MRYVLKIAYDGTDFAGWQCQKNARSVQETLEDGIFAALGVRLKTTASGRTDAGVHASGQICHFDGDLTVPPEKMPDCLNRYLPPDVRVLEGWAADEGFDSIRSAKRKTYCYSLYVASWEMPLKHRYAVRIDSAPSLEKLRSAAKLLASRNYTVFALDRKVGAPEENIIPIEADVTREESVAAAFEAVREQTEKLDAIVHFAGVYMLDSLFEMPIEAFERIFKVNLYGAYLVNKAFLPMMKKGSRILITTSELAPLDPLPFTGVYAVTKAALDKYAYSLRMEAQLLGVDVCVLRAGAVATDMLGASTTALDRFCESTKLYSCNAARFKKIVESVEARSVKPEKIAEKTAKILSSKRTRFAYSINRNPLLLMLNAMPKRFQLWVIKQVLK